MKQKDMAHVAYFCMEYGLDEKLPLYAGGLGVLAGDHLKSAYDLDIPLVGIGLLWNEGYSSQEIRDGWPHDKATEYDRDVLEDTGEQITVYVRGAEIPIKIWRTTAFGNAPLYLLDANVPGSDFWWVTKRLYGGMNQDRVAQEIVLGIGGVRALRKLGIEVDVYHFNEGHAVLAGVELIREKMKDGTSFEEAWDATRNEVVFTTHTPVPAGNEYHDHSLLQYMGAYNGLSYEQMEALGGDPFGMTVAGLRLSRKTNAVSKLHGITSRQMWSDVEERSPIIAITNGAHAPTWQDGNIRKSLTSDVALWRAHMEAKQRLIRFIKDRTGVTLDERRMLMGFARRAAAYKRSDLIFQRPEVIDPLLESGQLQLVFAGKAHPSDEAGKRILSHLISMTERFPETVIFLPNYDMEVARHLITGCDVWLNNPKRPLEASGTSGMKAAMNGVLNLSILDGWWPEGCWHGSTGWQIGGGYEGPGQDQHDLVSLYDVLINEVMVTYYEDRPKWIHMMRESIEMACTQFTTDRMVRDYYNLLYLPAASTQRVTSAVYQES